MGLSLNQNLETFTNQMNEKMDLFFNNTLKPQKHYILDTFKNRSIN